MFEKRKSNILGILVYGSTSGSTNHFYLLQSAGEGTVTFSFVFVMNIDIQTCHFDLTQNLNECKNKI